MSILKRAAIAFGLLIGSAALAYAAGETVSTWFKQSDPNPILVQGSDGTDARPVKTDTSGNLAVGGNVASGATDSGNPVKFGCVHNTTLPTVSNGQRVDCQANTRGIIRTLLTNNNAVSIDAGAPSDGLSSASFGLVTTSLNESYNGASFDRDFTCPSSAVINVAAAATTQLVALASSQIIRVCSFVISGDTLATTATFVYGTGANCATGQAALTGAMRMPDEGSIALSGMNGSLFRTIASNALCLTAATGAVTGFVTYAQY